jgi:phytoene dehydrogenase-like protein
VTSRHYDVVVLGRSPGALAAAALLARREFRVLVLGQGQLPLTYSVEGHLACRRTFTMLSATSPSFRRIAQELAQSQRFRRLTGPLDPMFSMLGPGFRLEVPPDAELFAREIEREFPEIRQLVDELYASFSEVNAAADAAFEKDAVWPPGSLWERIETSRIASSLPLSGVAPTAPLTRFPQEHPFRDVVELPAFFATHLDGYSMPLPAFALARLHGSWTRGIQALPRSELDLTEFLLERIEAHGGVCRLEGRATELIVERGRVRGVVEDGEERPTGAGAVVACLPGEAVADLAHGEGITKSARQRWPRITATAGRFVVSLVVRSAGVPEPLPTESFLVPSASDARRPIVHLQRLDGRLTPPREGEDGAGGTCLLVAEMLLPSRGSLSPLEAREAVLGTLREHLPFLDEHLIVVDSPHDGLPAWLYEPTAGASRTPGRKPSERREIDRIHLRGARAGAEPMEWLWSVEPTGYMGLAAEPVRGPIPGTYLVGPTVLPGLGQEGELLAAWGVARLITKSDSTRQKLRRQMWTKIETG